MSITDPPASVCYIPSWRTGLYTSTIRRHPVEAVMPSARRSPACFALLIGCLITSSAAGQSPDAESLRDKFRAERDVALKAKFPPETLARADDLAQRGEAALKNDPKAAARYFRDARWQLPYIPAGLPQHVVGVFGESRMRHA